MSLVEERPGRLLISGKRTERMRSLKTPTPKNSHKGGLQALTSAVPERDRVYPKVIRPVKLVLQIFYDGTQFARGFR